MEDSLLPTLETLKPALLFLRDWIVPFLSPAIVYFVARQARKLDSKKRADPFALTMFKKQLETYEKIAEAANSYAWVLNPFAENPNLYQREMEAAFDGVYKLFPAAMPYCHDEVGRAFSELIALGDEVRMGVRKPGKELDNLCHERYKTLIDAMRAALKQEESSEEVTSILGRSKQPKTKAA